MQQIELKLGIETHDLFFESKFVASISEEELFRIRADIAAAYENEVDIVRSGYYLLDSETQDEYHILTSGYMEDHNNNWWSTMMKSLASIIRINKARKKTQDETAT